MFRLRLRLRFRIMFRVRLRIMFRLRLRFRIRFNFTGFPTLRPLQALFLFFFPGTRVKLAPTNLLS